MAPPLRTFHHTPASTDRVLAIVCGLFISLHTTVHGTERVVNQYDTRHGLPVAQVLSLAQDARGFIWIGTMGGLVRFDGHEMRQWLPDTVRGEILDLATLPNGKLLALTQSTILEIDENAARPQVAENNVGLTAVSCLDVTRDGSAWAAAAGALLRRTSSGQWRHEPSEWFNGERVTALTSVENGELLVITTGSLWTLAPGNTAPALVARVPAIVNAWSWGGRYFALTFDLQTGQVLEVGSRNRAPLLSMPGSQPMSLAHRGDVIWATFDRFLVALRPGRAPETIGSRDRLASGGPLLVDNEGSLWVGTNRGLLQFPEPETRSWTDLDGLPSAHSRSLANTSEGMWVSTWQGLGRLEKDASGWRGLTAGIYHHTQLCTDSAGTLIVMQQPNGPLYSRVGGHFVSHPAPDHEWLAGCARSSAGGIWYATDHGLWFVSDGAREARVMTPPPDGKGDHYFAVLEDSRGRVWLSRGQEVCHSNERIARSSTRVDWHCNTLGGSRWTTRLIEAPSGAIWAATQDAGVWRWVADRWTQIPATRKLPSNLVRGFWKAADGTIWVLGAGIVVRVREEHDDPGWSVVERLTPYQGLPSEIAESLVEDADGAAWIATIGGVTVVPASARNAATPAPHVELVTAIVDGRATPIDRGVTMRSGDNTLELHFAALTFRDRGRLRFQLRLRPADPWIESTGGDPTTRFVNLGAGTYTVEARASLDGIAWSDPARLPVTVRERWYRTSWALALAALGLVGLGVLVHQARLAVATQLGRQRSGIARDLHDELGSGLGSIGILASVAAGSQMEEPQRQTMAATIADTAQELSGGLSDLVWSLSSRPVTLSALAAHLAERGSRLIPGPRPRFETRFPPTWPSGDLPLLVRRNVILIGLEALRNAARHADASLVWLSLAPGESSAWILEVGDDGRGMPGGAANGGGDERGHGRDNMFARARDIGARLQSDSTPGAGTVLRLSFRMNMRWRFRRGRA